MGSLWNARMRTSTSDRFLNLGLMFDQLFGKETNTGTPRNLLRDKSLSAFRPLGELPRYANPGSNSNNRVNTSNCAAGFYCLPDNCLSSTLSQSVRAEVRLTWHRERAHTQMRMPTYSPTLADNPLKVDKTRTFSTWKSYENECVPLFV